MRDIEAGQNISVRTSEEVKSDLVSKLFTALAENKQNALLCAETGTDIKKLPTAKAFLSIHKVKRYD